MSLHFTILQGSLAFETHFRWSSNYNICFIRGNPNALEYLNYLPTKFVPLRFLRIPFCSLLLPINVEIFQYEFNEDPFTTINITYLSLKHTYSSIIFILSKCRIHTMAIRDATTTHGCPNRCTYRYNLLWLQRRCRNKRD